MEYADFIKALRELRAGADPLFDLPQTHWEPAFREWRHRVTALIYAIEDCGYRIDCGISSRNFDIATDEFVTVAERIAGYKLDLQDTVNEIDSIVVDFEQHGDPRGNMKPAPPSRKDKKLESPKEITLSWLLKHAPAGLWLKFLGALVAAFLVGIGFSQTGVYSSVEDLWKAKTPESQAAKEASKLVQPTR